VKFSLDGAGGPLDASNASSLATQHQVRVILFGPGTDGAIVASAVCAWVASNFQCNLKTPKGLPAGTSYSIVAQETLTPNGPEDTFFAAPGTGNAATVNFK
jgi:hypothetical protein